MKPMAAASNSLITFATFAVLSACNGTEPLFALQARADRALEDGTTTNQGIPEGLHAAILWRPGCNGCAGGAPAGTEPWLSLQPIDITGSFPGDFTIEFNGAPPERVLRDGRAEDASDNYATGMLVLTTFDEPREYFRDPRFVEIGFSHPLLFAEDAAALGVVSMTPLYVSYVSPPTFGKPFGRARDLNMGWDGSADGEWLSPGYHVARHNSVAINAGPRYYACHRQLCYSDERPLSPTTGMTCSEEELLATCGAEPDRFSGIEVLEANDQINLTIGGEEDLLNALAGLIIDDLL